MKLNDLSETQKAELRSENNIQENVKSRPEKGHYPDWPYENLKKSLETTVSSPKIDLNAKWSKSLDLKIPGAD
jgi:hypothetical protein